MPVPIWLLYGAAFGAALGILTRPHGDDPPPDDDPSDDGRQELEAAVAELSDRLDAAINRPSADPEKVSKLESELEAHKKELEGLRSGVEARSRDIPESKPDEDTSSEASAEDVEDHSTEAKPEVTVP